MPPKPKKLNKAADAASAAAAATPKQAAATAAAESKEHDAVEVSSDEECTNMTPLKKKLYKLKKMNASACKRLRLDSDDDDEETRNHTVAQLLALNEKTKVDLIVKVLEVVYEREMYGLKEEKVLVLLADQTGCVLAEMEEKVFTTTAAGDSIHIAGAWFFPVEQRVRVAKDASYGGAHDPVKVNADVEKNSTVASVWKQHFGKRFRQIATIKQLDPQQERGQHFNIRATAIQVGDKQTWPGNSSSGPADYRVVLFRDDKAECIQVTFWRGDAIRKPTVGSELEVTNLRLNMFKGERTLNSYEGMTQIKLGKLTQVVAEADGNADLSVPTRYKREQNLIKIKAIERYGLLVYASCPNKACYFAKLKTDRNKPYCNKCLRKYDNFQGAKQGVKVDAVVTMETDGDGKVKRKVKLFTEAVGKLLEGGLGDYDASVTADDLHAAFALPIAVTGSISGDVLTITSVHPQANV